MDQGGRAGWRNVSSSPCAALIFTGGNVCKFLRGVGELQRSGEELMCQNNHSWQMLFALTDVSSSKDS